MHYMTLTLYLFPHHISKIKIGLVVTSSILQFNITAAPLMEQENQFFSLSDPNLILRLSLSMGGSIENTRFGASDDDATKVEDDFVFDIDPSLLVDSRKLLIGELITEHSHSIVYHGWWVF